MILKCEYADVLLVVLWVRLALNSRFDWLLGLNEFKMAAGVVLCIQDGGPLTLMTSPW